MTHNSWTILAYSQTSVVALPTFAQRSCRATVTLARLLICGVLALYSTLYWLETTHSLTVHLKSYSPRFALATTKYLSMCLIWQGPSSALCWPMTPLNVSLPSQYWNTRGSSTQLHTQPLQQTKLYLNDFTKTFIKLVAALSLSKLYILFCSMCLLYVHVLLSLVWHLASNL